MLAIALTLFAAPIANAGPAEAPVRNAAQRADNQRDQQDDRRDAAAIVDLVGDWNRAMTAGNRAAALQTDQRIFGWLEREIVESERDAAEARRESAQSSRELRGSRRQAGRQGGAVNQLERGDDRRDRRDDAVDSKQARKDLEQTKAINSKLKAMQPAFAEGRATPAQVQEKRGLLDALIVMAKRELAEGQEEMMEDRVESREDRRTRRR